MGRGQAEVKLMGALDDILLGTAAAAAKRTALAVVRKEKSSARLLLTQWDFWSTRESSLG